MLLLCFCGLPLLFLTLLSGPWEVEAWRGCSWGLRVCASRVGVAGALPHTRARCHGSHLCPRALALLPAPGVRPGLTAAAISPAATAPWGHPAQTAVCWGASPTCGVQWGSPTEPREGAAATELGLQRPPGQAARGIALELALAMPRASCPGCPTSPSPAPRCGCTAGREEAPQSSRAPNGGRLISGPSGPPQPLSATAVGHGWARSPPSAPPAPAGSALGGGRLAACPLDPF